MGLECATGLVELHVYDTKAAPYLLVPLAELEQLVHLRLSEGLLVKLDPLATVESLEILDLWDWVGNGDLSPLGGLPKLRRLALRRAELDSLEGLAGAPALEMLDLYATDVADLSVLSGIPTLVELQIGGTPVTDLAPLAGHPSLEELSASSSAIVDLSPLGVVPKLRYIYMPDSALTTLGSVDDMPAMRVLDIANTEVTDLGPLAGWPLLEELRMEGNVGPVDLSPLAGLPVRYLDASECGISDASVLAAFSVTPWSVDLSNNEIVELDGLVDLDWWLELDECGDLLLFDNPLSPAALVIAEGICNQTHVHVMATGGLTCEGGQTCITP